jgi:signal transduction histidine kinase
MFDKLFILMIVLNIMDCLALLGVSAFWGLFTLLLVPYSGSYRFVFVIFAVLMTFLYYLIYTVVRAQSEFIETTYKKEKQLLNRLREEDLRHKHTLRSTALRFENQRLQEKSELSQNLHDKIGHAINGSIFKLEAAKLLAYKDTAKSTEMIGDVVTALRCSADEIRLLLRDEKPPAELMNIGRLRALLSDFQDNYDIKTELEVEGDTARVPLNVFGILYDNTVEALSNSLKYARCAKVRVTLRVYNKILRYTVTDDGVGAQTITENMGLSGIRERILSVGGTVSVNGANGFEINILVPVPDAGRGDDADE